MNYKLVDNEKILDDGEHMVRTWDLFETQTGLLIKTFLKKEEAKSMLRHLNTGGGFAGFTPQFFTNYLNN
jgi:hypothetical protein